MGIQENFNRLRLFFSIIAKVKGFNWEGVGEAIFSGSWKTRLVAVFSVLLLVIYFGGNWLGASIPSSVLDAGIALGLVVTSWLAQEDGVPGKSPQNGTEGSLDNDTKAMEAPPLEPPKKREPFTNPFDEKLTSRKGG